MGQHVIFAAPFFMDATLRFIRGATELPGVDLTLISQDRLEQLPTEIRQRLAGHWRVDDIFDEGQLVHAATELERRNGKASRLFGPLEQLQVPVAAAREALGIDGLAADAARNFRDKARMKDVLRAADIPCARHVLARNRDAAIAFGEEVGYPVVVKPPAGAGGKSTYRIDDREQLVELIDRHPPDDRRPALLEEFLHGTEFSFDSVVCDGRFVWHSISRYVPAPLDVLENSWIQWCVILPRDISGQEFDPIRNTGAAAVLALGLRTGLSHMEWFRLVDDTIAISEVGARPPGAQITSLLSYAYDTDFYRAWPRLMVFGEFDVPQRRYAAGAAYLRGQGRGNVRAIHGLDEAQRRIGELVVEARLPRLGQAPSDSYEGDGYIIVRHPETAAVESALAEIVRTVRVELA